MRKERRITEDEVEYFEDLIREFKNRDLFTLIPIGLDDVTIEQASKYQHVLGW